MDWHAIIYEWPPFITAVSSGIGGVALGFLAIYGSIVVARINTRSAKRDQDMRHKVGTGDLALRERMETFKMVAMLSTRAQGFRETDAAAKVGISEQIAAMDMLAYLANEYDWVRPAVVSQLEDQLREAWYSSVPLELWNTMNDDRLKGALNQGKSQKEIDQIINDSQQGRGAAAHRDRMVAGLVAARDKITKAEPRTSFPEQKVYLGTLGPYHF